ncbi:prenyltransferase/squalene oxidase repeat-containing protein [Tundrisphaera lichenicola]|uniref:prenyltransferase/squalene oxidase repeat-containing protein n=1 Tax=Tundrisphaera lichenicola TaxID=2029860 RepID=UPI003EBC5127
MTGLNLETFLRLIRADLGTWASLALIALILAVMTWTSWGSRRALRKCLVLSIAAHVGLIAYGSSSPVVLKVLQLASADRKPPPKTERIRVTPWVEPDRKADGPEGRRSRDISAWDRDKSTLAMAEPTRPVPPTRTPDSPSPSRVEPTLDSPETVAPEVEAPALPDVEPPPSAESMPAEPPPSVAPGDPSEVASAPVEPIPSASESSTLPGLPAVADLRARSRPSNPIGSQPVTRPGGLTPVAPLPEAQPTRTPVVEIPSPIPARFPDVSSPREDAPVAAQADVDPGPSVEIAAPSIPSPGSALPDAEIRRAPRPTRPEPSSVGIPLPRRSSDDSAPPAMARAIPRGPTALPVTPGAVGRRSLSEVPSVYRSRLDPNRTSLARRAGASDLSEQAVERALDWLARHQDLDGRWDGGTARFKDGSVAKDDDSFTIHCPAGEVCFGECYYWEADTALTGLSLLAYLGAGYTHVDGKYAAVVGKGIEFLRRSQKPDGDLRGVSLAVGMYCHSMATLALCEAYALTGDPKLRDPVERAVAFLVRSRAIDGLSWRYAPGAPVGDTSILGWAVMALKSAKTVGIPIPSTTQAGILGWLEKVGTGPDGGLARYQPGEKVTPTMTAEAWACRQFLEVGGPGRASDEAAAFLIRNPTDGGGEFNVYYLYYGTLAMFQHGGEAWSTWNARVRDQIVERQQKGGHKAGSWDPDDSRYGTHGGRIYGTALSALTLEVYYRFLRLYEPGSDNVPVAPKPVDGGTRRAGLVPPGR